MSKLLYRKATVLCLSVLTALGLMVSPGYAQCPPTITLSAPSICEGATPQLILNTTPATGGPYSVVVNGVTYPGVVPGSPFAITVSEDGFWGTGVPSLPAVPDPNAYELGMKFRPAANGVIKGIRFYKTAAATGPFTGTLWSSTGAPLATGTFVTSASGWQELRFATPVAVTSGTLYVVSYYTPNGNYAQLENDFALADKLSTGGYMESPASGFAEGGNGLYRPGSSGFPTLTYNASNYFVDVIFSATEDNFFGASVPFFTDPPDTNPFELGVKFTPSVDGLVRGVRFYKVAAATGPFTGSLWSITGTQLATGTFVTTSEGWQELRFSTPVAVTAGTPYVASYYTPSGYYAKLEEDLVAVKTSLAGNMATEPSGGGNGLNGVYNAGVPGFPSLSFFNSNYFVDVIFTASASTVYDLTSITDGGTCADVGAPIASATLTINELPRGNLSGNGTQVAGQPSSILFTSTAGTGPYNLQINTTGYSPVTSGTPFTTGGIPLSQTTRIWSSPYLPTPAAQNDGLPVEVGMKFRSSLGGTVTALRFYKGVSDLLPTDLKIYAGTGGAPLATVTHQDAVLTGPGWREVTLGTPLAILPNTLYMVTYYSANGDYVRAADFLVSNYTSGPITVPAPGGPDGGNGQYIYGAGGGFPTNYFGILGGPNYFADVVFDHLTFSLPLDLTTITDANGCTSNVGQFVELSVQNPLPVTLRSFTASVTDANVKLDWSTASESNNRGFEIQRSDDGVKFVPIGFVDGAGTSQTIQKYTFLDRGRPNGRFFYRLKQVDYDNRFTLSNILSVEINGQLSFELGQSYPNPTHGAATITYSVPVKTNVRLVLYDGQGRVVSVLQNGERSAGKYAVTVPENLLKSGIYYYKIDAGGFTTTRKMIVQ